MKKLVLIFLIFILTGQLQAAGTLSVDEYFDRISSGHEALLDKDFESAFTQYMTVARWGDKDTQYFLAHLYFQGLGVKKDLLEGLAWLYLASEARTEWVLEADKLFQTLSRDQKLLLKDKVEQFIKLFGMDTQRINCGQEAVENTRKRLMVCRKQLHTATYVYHPDGSIEDFVFVTPTEKPLEIDSLIRLQTALETLGASPYYRLKD